ALAVEERELAFPFQGSGLLLDLRDSGVQLVTQCRVDARLEPVDELCEVSDAVDERFRGRNEIGQLRAVNLRELREDLENRGAILDGTPDHGAFWALQDGTRCELLELLLAGRLLSPDHPMWRRQQLTQPDTGLAKRSSAAPRLRPHVDRDERSQ